MGCEIVGCGHDAQSNSAVPLTGLCIEHEIDLYYWEVQQKENRADIRISTYIRQKNRELLG